MNAIRLLSVAKRHQDVTVPPVRLLLAVNPVVVLVLAANLALAVSPVVTVLYPKQISASSEPGASSEPSVTVNPAPSLALAVNPAG